MLTTLKDIFETNSVETPKGERIPLHSHTSKEQGLFLQEIMDEIKPKKSIEIGLAYGISTLFILEKHRELQNQPKSHIIIEAGDWGGSAQHNIEKEGLTQFCDYKYDYSDRVLPKLYYENVKIQFAYIDTTKLFDTVLQDFYFLNKMLEVGGVIVFDDCGGNWPGIQKVARFVNSLPHYKMYKGHYKVQKSKKFERGERIFSWLVDKLPYKDKYLKGYSLKTNRQLNLNYYCIAFQKISEDTRDWSWDNAF